MLADDHTESSHVDDLTRGDSHRGISIVRTCILFSPDSTISASLPAIGAAAAGVAGAAPPPSRGVSKALSMSILGGSLFYFQLNTASNLLDLLRSFVLACFACF